MSEKDVAKLEKNCHKLEEMLVKNDREYRDSNIKTEEARLAWEAAMYRCCQVGGRGGRREVMDESVFGDYPGCSLPPSRPWSIWSWRG